MRVGPVEKKCPDADTDVFDAIIGISGPLKKPQERAGNVLSQEVIVRLDYDESSIERNTALAYLERLQHHLEFPNELIL